MQEGSVQVVCYNCPPNLVPTEQMDSRGSEKKRNLFCKTTFTHTQYKGMRGSSLFAHGGPKGMEDPMEELGEVGEAGGEARHRQRRKCVGQVQV
ncbi:hypothetical protein FH972_026991 [Carpinus fangiana]|uniref:Uncharacterized protein n=1 Tax=Carpinus fangiana TaxID=176857 RepID=A0A5N6L5M3_9ROSI|nr:hypothetical protein FH972_026991 [Carpinus fangiana]